MNTPQRLKNAFIAVSGVGKIQPDAETGLLTSDIDTRERCTVSFSEVVTRKQERDCGNSDLMEEPLSTRAIRFTLNYATITPQIAARYNAWFFGASTSPTGSSVNDVQTLARTGTVDSGFLAIGFTLEGRLVKTKPIAWNASTADIQAALTTSKMLFIQPGDVTVSGDWTTGIVLTFGGRLAGTTMPVAVIDTTDLGGTTPGISVTHTTSGSQKHSDMSRSTSDTKVRTSFIVGNEKVTDRYEKYVGQVVESLTYNYARRQPVTLTVNTIGPWEPEILTSYSVPACLNYDALLTEDCRVLIDGNYETTDVNTLSVTLNDNVPVDESTAFGWDSIDIQDLERGDQPAYDINASIFGSQVDHIYSLAYNERTQDPVDVSIKMGMPGNRVTLDAGNAKVKFQDTRLGYAGALNKSTINLTITPYKDGGNPPVSASADLAQTTPFLTVSE